MNIMFSAELLTNNDQWNAPAVAFNLLVFAILKFTLTILALSCPIPAGVFGP